MLVKCLILTGAVKKIVSKAADFLFHQYAHYWFNNSFIINKCGIPSSINMPDEL